MIRERNSEYSNPIILMRKKSGKLRFCVNYRELNKRCCRDRYPIPLIDEHLDLLRGKKYFSSLDLKDEFHHIEVAKLSKKYTFFISPLGQFEFCKVPFGLCNGPSKFQKCANNTFKELIKINKVLVYFDQILLLLLLSLSRTN